MRLKSFQGKSTAEALRQVKEMLGDDAIIVSMKEEKGGWVRVTAAVEHLPDPPSEKSDTAGTTTAPHYTEEDIGEIMTDTFLKHRLPASVSDKILSAAQSEYHLHPHEALAAALGHVFHFEPSTLLGTTKPIILVGPPGAGKTLMAAKLAARSVMNKTTPAVITTDIARAGGVEQLTAFLDILELPLYQAEDTKTLQEALLKSKKADNVIIDTGGLNPFDPQEMKMLAQLMGVTEMDAALVLPAGIDAEESAEIALTFDVLGVRNIVPTRLDFARRIGGILSAADRAGLSLGTASHTPQVARGILELTPHKMADLLLPHVPKAAAKAQKGKSS